MTPLVTPDCVHLVVLLCSLYSVIHCGVVGNIQAFHVCAPGSIPGDGVFLSASSLFIYSIPTFLLYWIPTIAQLVERRTVDLIDFLRSLVRIRLVGSFFPTFTILHHLIFLHETLRVLER